MRKKKSLNLYFWKPVLSLLNFSKTWVLGVKWQWWLKQKLSNRGFRRGTAKSSFWSRWNSGKKRRSRNGGTRGFSTSSRTVTNPILPRTGPKVSLGTLRTNSTPSRPSRFPISNVSNNSSLTKFTPIWTKKLSSSWSTSIKSKKYSLMFPNNPPKFQKKTSTIFRKLNTTKVLTNSSSLDSSKNS